MKKIIFLSLVLTSIPSMALGWGCCWCTVINDPWSHVRHAAMQMLSNTISSTTGLELDAEENRGRAAVSTQKMITATVEKTAESHITAYAAAMKGHAMSMTAWDNAHNFSPLSQSSYGCCLGSEGAGIVVGNNVRDTNYQDLQNSIGNYNKQTLSREQMDSNMINTMSAAGGVDIANASKLFPFNKATNPADAALVAENIIASTNPTAYPILTKANFIDTSAGEMYNLLKKIKTTRLAVPQQILSEIASNKIASYPMSDWVQQMNTSITNSAGGTSPYVDSSGNISADGLIAIQVESRYGNPAWLIDAHRKTKAGIYREMVLMKATGLEIKRRVLQSRKKEIWARASMVAQKEIAFMQPLLEEAYVAALIEGSETNKLATNQ